MKSRSISALVIVLLFALYYVIRAEVPGRTAITCGCTDGSGIIDRLLPHYVKAGTTAGPQFPEDTGVYGWVRFSHVASNDFPGDHDWHDVNFYVALDSPFRQQLASDGNYLNNNSFIEYSDQFLSLSKRDERLMEVEWDISRLPEKFWPSAGDRIWITGRYIWDCGHPKGYHTEIHPPTALAFTRHERDTLAPAGPNVLANKTYVYIHGRSGMTDGSGSPFLNTAVATRDYEFDIDLPDNNDVGRRGYARIAELPYGGPSPILTVDDAAKKVHVRYPLKLNDPSPDRRFGAIIFSGWRTATTPVTYRELTVTIDKLVIRQRHGLLCQSDWNLWVNVFGRWVKLENTFGLIEGSIITINKEFKVAVPNTDEARLIVQVSGWAAVIDALFATRRNVLDIIAKFNNAANAAGLEDTDFEGHIGFLYKPYRKSDNLGFGVGSGFDQPPGDLSHIFQDMGNEKGAGPEQAETGLTSTRGDFALFYKITEP